MSTKTKEIAENIKSQRKHRNVTNQNEFDHDKKDEEIVMNALKRMKKRGINIKQFMWQAMSELCDQNDDEIGDNNNKNEVIKISQLINTKYTEMCKYGHGWLQDEKDNILDNKCIQCSSMIERKYCIVCLNRNDPWALLGSDVKSSDVKKHIYCIDCRKTNAQTIKNTIETEKMKAEIIRKELIKNPRLERDLLCNMERRAAIDSLIYDINNLTVLKRSQWILLLFDMDYLKAWNTAIGHVSTDKLIKQIGNIMHKYVKEINDGKWINENDDDESLEQSFVFRTGGDEFVMALKCVSPAVVCKLHKFYNSFKSEINALGSNIKQFVNRNEWKETQRKLNDATDRNGNTINLDIVGLSCGIFVSDINKCAITDWLSVTDKIALETAKKINGINKNHCAIFHEAINDLIPNDKVLQCLKIGVCDGYDDSRNDDNDDDDNSSSAI
eukprot:257380_1